MKKNTAIKRMAVSLILIISLTFLTACPPLPEYNGPWDVFDSSGADMPLSFDKYGEYYQPWYFDAFGVQVALYAYGKNGQKKIKAADKMFAELETEVTKFDNQVSTTKENSDVYKLNHAAKDEEVVIGEYTKIMYEMSLSLYDESGGLFDPCAFNMVDYWGFAPWDASEINAPLYIPGYGDVPRHPQGPSYNADLLDPLTSNDVPAGLWAELRKISTLRDESNKINGKGKLNVECYQAQSGPNAGKWVMKKTCDNVSYGGKTYTLRIDFGALGKGYAADIGKELAAKYCITKGFIYVNSSIYMLKDAKEDDAAPDKGLEINITDPRNLRGSMWYGYEPMGTVSPVYINRGVSTSGDYEKTYFYEEVAIDTRYCHIINPVSGYPVNVNPATGKNYSQSVISATILHESAAMTDAYATIAMLIAENGNHQAAIDWLTARDAHAMLIVQTISGGEGSYELKFVNMQVSDFTVNPYLSNTYIIK